MNPRNGRKLFAAMNPNLLVSAKRWAGSFNFLGYRVLEHTLAGERAPA
jgi:hypothetical protein